MPVDQQVIAFGLAFDSALSFEEILERLNGLGPWSWYERDSAWYGNLASARTESLRLDLVESGPNELPGGRVEAGAGRRYAISLRPGRDQRPSPEAWKAAADRIEGVILPALGASGLSPTEPID